MCQRKTVSYKTRLKTVQKSLAGEKSNSQLAREAGVSISTIYRWIKAYQRFGEKGLRTLKKYTEYPPELKKAAVEDYLSGQYTHDEILDKYKIRGQFQTQGWIKLYNRSDQNNCTINGTGRTFIMTKSRKTTYQERIEIVAHCIKHNKNYRKTCDKYQVSYNQIYAWVRKYETKGVDGLVDGRGKAKHYENMTELEKLDHENRLLKAKLEQKEIEVLLLKKIEEIERR